MYFSRFAGIAERMTNETVTLSPQTMKAKTIALPVSTLSMKSGPGEGWWRERWRADGAIVVG